jgi:hypothetical protein
MRGVAVPYCKKTNRRIDENSGNSINPALVGFPEWCPLETLETKNFSDYRKEIKDIMKIVTEDISKDALEEASYYLNSVVENAKKKAQTV